MIRNRHACLRSDAARSEVGRALALVLAAMMLGSAAPLAAQARGDRAAAEPRSITFPAVVVEELNATGEAFLPGTGMIVKLGEGITAVVGVAASPDEQLLIVDGVIVGLSTDENAAEITRSSDIEVRRSLAIDQPGAARFGRPILLISARDAEARPASPVAMWRPPPGNADQNAPLIVVDGVIVSGRAAMAEIPADRIERIEVIKGAGAAARYGGRAANGVIFITTKK